MGETIFKDFNLGGMADSLYQGLANSLYRVVGMDIHSTPGILKLANMNQNSMMITRKTKSMKIVI